MTIECVNVPELLTVSQNGFKGKGDVNVELLKGLESISPSDAKQFLSALMEMQSDQVWPQLAGLMLLGSGMNEMVNELLVKDGPVADGEEESPCNAEGGDAAVNIMNPAVQVAQVSAELCEAMEFFSGEKMAPQETQPPGEESSGRIFVGAGIASKSDMVQEVEKSVVENVFKGKAQLSIDGIDPAEMSGQAQQRATNAAGGQPVMAQNHQKAANEKPFQEGLLEESPGAKLVERGGLVKREGQAEVRVERWPTEESLKDVARGAQINGEGLKVAGQEELRKGFLWKGEVLDGRSLGEKVVKMESASEESSLSFSNNSTSEKIPGSVQSLKGAEPFQKVFAHEVSNQLAERLALNAKVGQTAIQIQLKPEFLGRLQVKVSTENDQVMIKILTEMPMVKEIIQNHVGELRAALQSHGLNIDKFEVFVAQDSNQYGKEYEQRNSQKMNKQPNEKEGGNQMVTDDVESRQSSKQAQRGSSLVDFFA